MWMKSAFATLLFHPCRCGSKVEGRAKLHLQFDISNVLCHPQIVLHPWFMPWCGYDYNNIAIHRVVPSELASLISAQVPFDRSGTSWSEI